MPNATIDDVANYSGVSQAKMSGVVNHNSKVEDMRSRVLHTIWAQSSNIIDLVISNIQNPYFLSVIGCIEDAAYVRQMNLILCNAYEDPAKERTYLKVMEDPTTPFRTVMLQPYLIVRDSCGVKLRS